MLLNFRNSLKKFIEDRVDEINNKLVIKNKKYKELADYSINVHLQIRDNLPAHVKKLIDEYETINTSMQCISEEIIYQQGFIDGIKLEKIVKLLLSQFI